MTGERSTATSTTVPAPRQPGGSALTMRLDGEGTVIHASSELLDLLGRPPGDVLDVSLESLVPDRPPLSVQRELASH